MSVYQRVNFLFPGFDMLHSLDGFVWMDPSCTKNMDLHGISICASECSFCMERPSVVCDLRGVVLWPFMTYEHVQSLKVHQGLQSQSYFLLASIHPKHPMFAEFMSSNFWAHVQTQTYKIYINLLRFICNAAQVYPARLRRLSQFRPFKLPCPHSTTIFHLLSISHHISTSHQIPPVFVAQRPAKASQSACNGYCAGHTVSGWLAKFRAQHLVFRTTLGEH